MKKMRILLCCILLMQVMVFGVFAGGGSQPTVENNAPNRSNFNPASFPRQPDNYPMHILTVSHYGELISNTHPAFLQLQEHTRTRIRMEYLLNANYAESMNTRLAARDMPAVVAITGNTSPIMQAAQEGAFWDITDVYTMYNYLAEADYGVMTNVSINGRFYGIYRERTIGRGGMIYRRDWLRNLGMNEPRTIDELYQVLRAFTFNDPDRNGINDTYGMTLTGAYMGPFFDMVVMMGGPNTWGVRNGQLTPWFEYPEFIQAMDWFKRLYDEGIINRDFAALQTTDWAPPIGRGQAGWHMDVADEITRTATRLVDGGFITREAADRGDHVWAMGSVANSRGQMFSRPTAGHQGYVALSTTGVRTFQDLHYHLEFLNFLNGPIGVNLQNWGALNVNYTIRPDGQWETIPVEQIPNGWDVREGFNQFRMMNNYSQLGVQTPIQERFNEIYLENLPISVHNPVTPIGALSPTWSTSSTSLGQIITDAVINYIMGTIDRAGFDREVARWYREGGQRSIEELQAVYAATR